MQKLIGFIYFIFVLLNGSKNLQARTYLPSGCSTYIICKDVKSENGEYNGEQTCHHPKNEKEILIRANWKNDKLQGEFYCAKDDGTPYIKAKYNEGELEGLFEEYSRQLKKWHIKRHYKEGKREGIETIELSEGRKRVSIYKKDMKSGFTLILDKEDKLLELVECEQMGHREKPENCEKIPIPGYENKVNAYLKEERKREQAEKNKSVEKKYNSGKIRERYNLVNGKFDGNYESFYESGQLKVLSLYKKGERIEEKVFFEDGKLKSHQFLKNQSPYLVKEYYQNGSLKSEIEEVPNPKDKWQTRIQFKYYFDNGKLEEEGQKITTAGYDYFSGYLDGEIKRYSEEGKLILQANYKNGRPVGKLKSFPIKGRYNFQEEYNEKGILLNKKIFDKTSEKLLKNTEFYPDGSTKSNFIDPEFEKDEEK